VSQSYKNQEVDVEEESRFLAFSTLSTE